MLAPTLFAREVLVVGVLVFSGLGLAQECAGQDVGSEAWFEETWTQASRWKPSLPLHLRASFDFHNHVDEELLKSLRARPEGDRSQADRKLLERIEWEAAHPLVRWTVDVCTDGARYRYSASNAAGGGGLHFALGKDTDWLLTEGLLRIAPPDMAKAEYGVRNYFDTADQIVRIAVWAGMGDPKSAGLQPTFSRLDGKRWEGGVSSGGKGSAISLIRGRLAPEGMPGINGMAIQSRTLADEALRASVPLGTIEYVSWSSNEILHRFVVDQVQWRDGQGRVVQSMKIDSIQEISVLEMDKLMGVPSNGATDSWGYIMNINTIQDVRPNHLTQTKLENGISTPIPLSIPLGEETDSRGSAWLSSFLPVVLGVSAILCAWGFRKLRSAAKGA